jgi:hypothetical protein
MKFDGEKAALCLTVPSLVGIVLRVVVFFQLSLGMTNRLDDSAAGNKILWACLLIGPITSLICFVSVKIRSYAIASCHIINGIWLVYVVCELLHFHLEIQR